MIVIGVTFLSFLTATVTSYFVSAEQEVEQARELEFRAASEAQLREVLGQLEARLASIESMLRTRLGE